MKKTFASIVEININQSVFLSVDLLWEFSNSFLSRFKFRPFIIKMSQSSQQYFYAVGVGRSRGVFNTWDEIKPLVSGIRNAKYRKFRTHEEAQAFVDQHASPIQFVPNAFSPRAPLTPQTPVTPRTPITSQMPSQANSTINQTVKDHLREKSRQIKTEFSDNQTSQSSSQVSVSSQFSLSSGDSVQHFSQTSTLSQVSVETQLQNFHVRLTTLEQTIKTVVEDKTKEIEKLKADLANIQSQYSAKQSNERNSNFPLRLRDNEAEEEAGHPTKRAKLMETDSNSAGPSHSNDNGTENKMKFTMDSEGYCIVFTDGACINNGKYGAKAGIGVWFGENHPLNLAQPLLGDCAPTNNNAEIQAASTALNLANYTGLSKVSIHTDSEFTINCATKWMQNWKQNGWRKADGKPVINRQQLEILDEILKELQVKWVHVRGHSNIIGNEMADKLANEGAAQYNSGN